jgi:predicted SnoaL-like aldol condensation-catalyzing enzyme
MRHSRTYVRAVAVLTALVVAATVTSTVALAGPPSTQLQSVASQRQNIQLVQSALQVVFNEHRVDQVDRFFTPDFVQHSPLVSPDYAGREGLKAWLTGIVVAIPDLTYQPGDPMADGDRVMIFADVRGTIVGDLPSYGIKATGQHLLVNTAQVFRVAHGRIAEHWEVVDTGPLVQLALASAAG